MSDRKIKFRISMRGYNKEDVNSYIESLNIKCFEAEVESKKKIAELENKVTELEQAAKSNSDAELEELRAKYTELDNLVVGMNDTIDKLNEEKNALEKENADLATKVADYERMNEASSEIYEKSSKYDKVSEQIGSMIVSASARAESIVSEAELKARVASKNMIDTTLEKLNEINEKYTGKIASKTIQLTDALRELSLSAESFRTDTNTSIEEDCIKLKESLEYTKRVILEDNNE